MTKTQIIKLDNSEELTRVEQKRHPSRKNYAEIRVK